MGHILSSTSYNEEHQNLASSMNAYFMNFKVENKIISEETINLITFNLEKGYIDSVGTVIDDVLKEIDSAPLNIAVTGESGVGKSSFINALRGVGYEEEDAAPTDVVETTMKATPYKHPCFPHVTLWDLPGIGTTNFRPQDYLRKVKFDEYDFFIIISATRFKENDAQLAKAIKGMKKNFYFVRTKVDIDLDNEQKSKPKNFERGEILQKIRNNCLVSFRQLKMDEPQIFLVSTHDVSKYDFPILIDTLLKDLPAQKRHMFMLSLPNVTKEAIERKRGSLGQKIWLEALKAGAWATLPMVGIFSDNDIKKLEASLKEYRVLFGVDDITLQNVAEKLQMPVEGLQAIIESPNLLEKKKGESREERLLKYVERFCSASGTLLGADLHFRETFYLQLHFLDTVANDARTLLKKTVSETKLTCHWNKSI
ncbi:interferon-inducible GTPase 1-like [Elephas maximus indicus]|uniref:interferon-inducible GTPase 1-like n=1 Tax=Elephas maximus indicus TaxID=99487 RepID=UPI002116667D|nr:interferon-inducible GTPase 1-like [Elephas maximus indicus]XP_049730064.1 interferon-inducible GTPase 1-like [Elephas maximus indicus]XP_049730065.1 interferon-inducible GTPase 1-like [Elephas maximus indicus]XP_049730066.1 interferon-inducible GTPase 1-like [Elephas maximus indicus]